MEVSKGELDVAKPKFLPLTQPAVDQADRKKKQHRDRSAQRLRAEFGFMSRESARALLKKILSRFPKTMGVKVSNKVLKVRANGNAGTIGCGRHRASPTRVNELSEQKDFGKLMLRKRGHST